jgi:cytochrome c-type biogenesis protein CcmH/NrfF
MKTAAAVIVLVMMPLGFFVLAAMIVNRMLAKRRQQCPDRTQRLSRNEDPRFVCEAEKLPAGVQR